MPPKQQPGGLALPFPLSAVSPPPRAPPRRSKRSTAARSPSAPGRDEPAFLGEAQAFSELIYRPHTLLALNVGACVLLWFGFQDQEHMDRKASWASGTLACVACFLLYATLQFRDSILMRPHPAFWRFIHGAAIIYFLGLIFLFMQPKRWGREWLQVFDSELGKQAPAENTKEYATDCRLIDEAGFPSQVFTDTFFDIFVFSHFIGWFGFALIMRDVRVCWTMSFLFEILEISAQDVMVNFQECWWDHAGLDLCGANAAGIFVGMQVVHYLELKTYNWVGLRDIPKLKDKMKRVARQYTTPASFETYDWDVFRSFRRFGCLVFIICLLDAVQLSVFFLKYALWMPPTHWVVTTRTLLWLVLAIPACREFYQFTVSDNDPWARLGPNGWISIAIFCAEVAVATKYGIGEYENKGGLRDETIYAWGASTVMLLGWMVMYFRKLPSWLLPDNAKPPFDFLLDCLYVSIPMPLVGLAVKECLRTFDDFGLSSALFGRVVHTAVLNPHGE